MDNSVYNNSDRRLLSVPDRALSDKRFGVDMRNRNPVRMPTARGSSNCGNTLFQSSSTAENLKKPHLSSMIQEPAQHFESTSENSVCSMFLIDVAKNSKAYRYDVEICEKRRGKSLTKASDDGQRSLLRNLCFEILTTIHQKTSGLGMAPGSEVVYDCRSTLFTSSPIHLPNKSFDISAEDINEYVKTYCGSTTFSVTIVANQSCAILNLSDFSQYDEKTSVCQEDRTIRTFFEMAITQFSINENLYTPIGAGKLFETPPNERAPHHRNSNHCGEEFEKEKGIVFRSGVLKGVRFVQNHGSTSPALVLDAKISAFFKKQPLLNIFLSQTSNYPTKLELERIKTNIQNLRVEVSYNPRRNFIIGGLTDEPLSQIHVPYEGRTITMAEFFKRKYNITLHHTQLPAVTPQQPHMPKEKKNQKSAEFFPIELLLVMPDQRVPIEKMDKRLSEKLLRLNSVSPAERLQKIKEHASQLGIFEEKNAVLCAFGIRILSDSCKTVIGVREPPRICYGETAVIEPEPLKANWSKASAFLKYIKGAEIASWVILCDQRNLDSIKSFAKKVMAQAEKKGMALRKGPRISTFDSERNEDWTEKFIKYAETDVDFIMLIDSKFVNTHDTLKYLEALYKVVTQHITFERVKEILSGRNAILENIIHKMNVKYFGLNYTPILEKMASKFALERNQTLVIAYDVAHPPPTTNQERRYIRALNLNVDCIDPSVVGICANMTSNPHEFVGDYFYQQSRKESVDTKQLQDRVAWILKNLKFNRPTSSPKYVFILRDGLSEGQFSMAINEELPAIKDGLRTFNARFDWKIIFVIGTKRHFKKFFIIDRNGEIKNLVPGSVANEKFVRADIPEFFMQSHYPIKGVGKPVQYSVVTDEIGVTQDELQGFLNGLCYSHQIISSAISIPEPIYQSDELAKRGRNNYLKMKRDVRAEVPKTKEGLVDVIALGQKLSYQFDMKNQKSLALARFTA